MNANGTLDVNFDPKANSTVYSVTAQADGKILLGGTFTTLQPNGAAVATARQYVARVNADGTLDTGFDPKTNGDVNSVAVQADGRILLGGEFTTLQPNGAVDTTARSKIARVNGDGTLDTGFDPKANDIISSVAVQADGKILLGGGFTSLQPNGAVGTTARQYVARVNADGTLDTGFDPKANGGVNGVAVQADGKILLGGYFTTLQPNGTASASARNRFARLTNDVATQVLTVPSASRAQWLRGGASPEAASVTFELSTDGGTVYAPLAAGTRISGGWELTGLNLPASGHLRARARTTGGYLNGSSGLVESVTAFTLVPTITGIAPASGSRLGGTSVTLSGTNFNGATAVTFGGVAATSINVVSSIQISATTPARAAGVVDVAVTTPGGTGTGTGLFTYAAAPGDLDLLNLNLANLAGDAVLATAVQPDGKTIIGGRFTSVLGVARSNLARLNADGTLDNGFDPKPNDLVFNVAVQADGKILLGGNFTTLQPNGAVGTTSRQCVARVNADGTLDTGFDPNANNAVYGVAVQADGKILLTGNFSTLQPNGAAGTTARSRIARVNGDGTLDTGFDPKPNGTVNSVAVQADGMILLGGQFITLQPNGAAGTAVRWRIARVNVDGTLDSGFDPKANHYVQGLAVQADGKILLAGQFTTVQPNGAAAATARQRIARVNADGTLDPGFDPKANGTVYGVAVQADGKILLGGQFTTLQPNGAASATARNFFARLTNDVATQTLTVPSASRVQWLRGGASPEAASLTFELSTDGGTVYAPLAVGTRMSGGWELTGLNLPASGNLRARARTTGGYLNSSGGLVESVAVFGPAVAPTVTTIAPTSGSTLGGTSVTLSGTNFNGATAVTFGGVPATGINVVSSIQITATTPAHVEGTVDVTVTTPGGTATGTGLFTYVAPNTAPTFSGYAASTPYQTAATISFGKLLTAAADADGDALNVTSAGPSSTQGGTVSLQASSVLYTPPTGFSGADSFPITVTDARGASVIGTVTVTVQSNTGIGTNPPVLTTLSGGRIGLDFQGIPGRSYEIQRSTNLSNWQTLTSVTAPANGAVSFIDETPPQPNGYYRLRKP